METEEGHTATAETGPTQLFLAAEGWLTKVGALRARLWDAPAAPKVLSRQKIRKVVCG